MAERSKALDWKSSNIARCSWVRIPLSPPLKRKNGALRPVFRFSGWSGVCGRTHWVRRSGRTAGSDARSAPRAPREGRGPWMARVHPTLSATSPDFPRELISSAPPERWPSGRRRLIGSQVTSQGVRGFESHSLRHPSVANAIRREFHDFQRPRMIRFEAFRAVHQNHGVPHRFLRDDQPSTPPGPEGSNGRGDVGCRSQAGAGRLPARV